MEIKIIPAIIAAAFLIIFLVPFAKGIVCLGNCVGAALSAVILLIFVFWTPFTSFTGRVWEYKTGKIMLSALAALAAICIVIAVIISALMVRAAYPPPDDDNMTVVVLGCQVKERRPSLMLKRRLDTAYDYLSEHGNVCVIVSGGRGSDELISEAQCMKEYLISKGIAPERIYTEDSSSDTYENLKFSYEIIKEERLPREVALVTDAYHQLRAQMTADQLGITASGISCRTSWWLIPTYWVREWFGVTYYKVFGQGEA